jgi:hypothetical protein
MSNYPSLHQNELQAHTCVRDRVMTRLAKENWQPLTIPVAPFSAASDSHIPKLLNDFGSEVSYTSTAPVSGKIESPTTSWHKQQRTIRQGWGQGRYTLCTSVHLLANSNIVWSSCQIKEVQMEELLHITSPHQKPLAAKVNSNCGNSDRDPALLTKPAGVLYSCGVRQFCRRSGEASAEGTSLSSMICPHIRHP